jgi:hypothetical protein
MATSASPPLTCSTCGGELRSTWKFCVRCGSTIVPADEPREEEEEEKRQHQQPPQHQHRLPELNNTYVLAKKAYGASARGRAGDRKRQRVPSSSTTLSERSRLLLLQQRRDLERAQQMRSKQERMVALLEMKNVVSRDSELGIRSSAERRPGSGSTHFNLTTPRLVNVSPTKFPLKRELEALKPDLSYTEWHLKTTFGVHNFEERIKADMAEAALLEALQKEEEEREAELERLRQEEEQRKSEEERLRRKQREEEGSDEDEDEDERANDKEKDGEGEDEAGQQRRQQQQHGGSMPPASIESGAVGTSGSEAMDFTADRQRLMTAPNEGAAREAFDKRRDLLQSAPSLTSVIDSKADDWMRTDSPIRLAPGTPLTGPQSLPSATTASFFTGSKPLRLPIDVLEAADNSADQHMARTAGSLRSDSQSPLAGLQDSSLLDPASSFDARTGVFLSGEASEVATEDKPAASWFWGASSRRGDDNEEEEGFDEGEKDNEEVDDEDDEVDGSSGTFLKTTTSEDGAEERKVNDAHRGTGMFWRGNSGATLLYEERIKKQEQVARAQALELANSTFAPEPAAPETPMALDDAASLGNDSAISGVTITEFAPVKSRVARLGEDDEGHPKDRTFGEFRGWWSKYVTHLFETGSSSSGGGPRGLLRGMRRGESDEDDAQSKAMHERLLGLLHEETKRFLKPKEVKLIVEELRALKARIVECYRHEKMMAVRLEAIAVEIEQRKSKATIAVAEVQFKVANEHNKQLAVQTRIAVLAEVPDEFTERAESSLEEESALLKRMALLKRRIAKADARLATALAVEARVHRECAQQLYEQKVTSMVCRQDTLLAMRRHEDAVYALHLRIRHAAATRIQNLYRGGRAWKSYISKLDALEAALGDFDQKAGRKEDRLISRAAAHLQGFCRIMQARDRMFVRVQQEYQKKYDKITGSHYYFITRTKRSVWHKPKVR